MGEIFRREHPQDDLPFTGERITTAARGQIEVEHLHRYLQARDGCRGKDVLDVASGEGYGSAMLAQVAKSVVGVEIDPDSVAHANATYAAAKANLEYRQGDARRIPLADASVDVVNSFETIEHFYEHEAFLAEARRVLRPDGVLIVSTPDRDVYSPAGQPANPFHVREMSKDEFRATLSAVFPHVVIYNQRTLLGSALLPDGGIASADAMATYERRDDEHIERCDGLPRARYLVAYALVAALPPLPPGSLYIDTGELDFTSHAIAGLSHDLNVTRARLHQLQAEDGHRHQAVALLQEQQAASDERLGHMHAQSADDRLTIDDLRAKLAQARADLMHREADIAALHRKMDEYAAQAVDAAETARVRNGLEAAARCRERGQTAAIAGLERRLAATEADRDALADRIRTNRRELARLRFDLGTSLTDDVSGPDIWERASASLLVRLLEARSGDGGVARDTRCILAAARRFAGRGQWAAAEASYRKALARQPNLARVWVQFGHAMKEQGDLWAALGAYGQATRLDHGDADAPLHLGHAQKALGLHDRAAYSLQRSLNLRPGHLDTWHDLIGLGVDRHTAIDHVLRHCETVVGTARRERTLRFRLVRRQARKAARSGRWQDAAARYAQLVKIAPLDPHCWLLYGHAAKESGDASKAVAAYMQALVLDPVDHEPRRHIESMRMAVPA